MKKILNDYKELFKTLITIMLCVIIMIIGWSFLVVSIPFVWNKWYCDHICGPITDRLDNLFRYFGG